MASLVQILFELHKYDGSTSKSGFSKNCFHEHVLQSVECAGRLDNTKTSLGPICRQLKIEQGLMSIGAIGSVIWDCAAAMIAVFPTLPEFLSPHSTHDPLNVLELGAGTGVAGIAAHYICVQRGHHVRTVLTDQSKLLPLIRRNIVANINPKAIKMIATPATVHSQTQPTPPTAISESAPPLPPTVTNAAITARELNWGQALPSWCVGPPDVLLLSDVLYCKEAFPKLLLTMRVLVGRHTRVLLGFKKRVDERERAFFQRLQNYFSVEIVADKASVLAKQPGVSADGVWVMRLRAPHSWTTSASRTLVARVLHFLPHTTTQRSSFRLVCSLWREVESIAST